jgi:hypothetical protein
MRMNRREFLQSSAAVLGAAAISEGIPSALTTRGSKAGAASPAPQCEIYAPKYESCDKLRDKATSIDLLFPGHDMSLATDYPRVAEDVTRFV